MTMSTSTFEPELDQPLPRRVAASEGCGYGCGIWFVRLFILPHTLVGVFLIFTAITRIVLALGVFMAGTEVDGRIVRKIETKGKKESVYYSAEYVYTVDQVEYSDTVSLNSDQYAAMREGQPISVKVFVPGIEGGHWPSVGGNSPLLDVAGTCVIALFWNGILSVFLYPLYYLPWRHRWMVRRGLPAAAIVRDVQRWTNKNTKMVKARYEYAVPPDGHSPGGVFSGKMTSSDKEGETIQVGTIVTVLYSPRRPHRSLVYRLALFKAVLPGASGSAPIPDADERNSST
jgi:hypothetical protein